MFTRTLRTFFGIFPLFVEILGRFCTLYNVHCIHKFPTREKNDEIIKNNNMEWQHARDFYFNIGVNATLNSMCVYKYCQSFFLLLLFYHRVICSHAGLYVVCVMCFGVCVYFSEKILSSLFLHVCSLGEYGECVCVCVHGK